MRATSWLSAALFASALGVVGFTADTAAAAPCCSAPICQREVPPPICAFCSPSCFGDADDTDEAQLVYDNEAGLCYVE